MKGKTNVNPIVAASCETSSTMKDSLPSTRNDFIRRPLPQGSGS
jgi:hypothetical protein